MPKRCNCRLPLVAAGSAITSRYAHHHCLRTLHGGRVEHDTNLGAHRPGGKVSLELGADGTTASIARVGGREGEECKEGWVGWQRACRDRGCRVTSGRRGSGQEWLGSECVSVAREERNKASLLLPAPLQPPLHLPDMTGPTHARAQRVASDIEPIHRTDNIRCVRVFRAKVEVKGEDHGKVGGTARERAMRTGRDTGCRERE